MPVVIAWVAELIAAIDLPGILVGLVSTVAMRIASELVWRYATKWFDVGRRGRR